MLHSPLENHSYFKKDPSITHFKVEIPKPILKRKKRSTIKLMPSIEVKTTNRNRNEQKIKLDLA